MDKYERVSKQIAETIASRCGRVSLKQLGKVDRDNVEKATIEILSLEGVRIEADDQALPETRLKTLRVDIVAMRDKEISNADFVKCLPKRVIDGNNIPAKR